MTTTRDSAAAQHHDTNTTTFFLDLPSPNETNNQSTRLQTTAPSTPRIPSTTGPVGEAALPPSRPSLSYSVAETRPTTSTGRGSRRTPGNSIYPSDSPSSPPPSASRTHVPNIISSAFLRPISAKRAQRQDALPRPFDPPVDVLPIARKSQESGRRSQKSHRHRNSNASIVTVDGQPRPLVDPDAPPLPQSRATDASASADNNRIESLSSDASRQPLQSPELLPLAPPPGSKSLKNQSSPRTPMSIRTSWNRPSRPHEENMPRDGRLKLSSTPPSPAYPPEKSHVGEDRPNLGRNHEYYNGNATFFLQGRLINTRQRPLNLLTAFVAILPAILFFVFS